MLLLFNLELRKVRTSRRCSLSGALNNLKENGLNPRTIIDVGAAFGSWSLLCSKTFQHSQYILIEGLKEYEIALQKATSNTPNASYKLCCVSDSSSLKTIFVHSDLVGSSLKKEYEPHNQSSSQKRIVPCKTLNEICLEEHLSPPYLIKMDIQGAELEALHGASTILKHTEVIILEVSLIDCLKETPSFNQMTEELENLGFIVHDIFGHNYRPLDGALTQVDIVFIQKTSPLRKSKWYANKIQRNHMNENFVKKLKKEGVWTHSFRLLSPHKITKKQSPLPFNPS